MTLQRRCSFWRLSLTQWLSTFHLSALCSPSSRAGFITCHSSDQIVFVGGGCPVHCRMFSNIPGLCLLVFRPHNSDILTKIFSDFAKCPLGGPKCPLIKKHWSNVGPAISFVKITNGFHCVRVLRTTSSSHNKEKVWTKQDHLLKKP